MEAPLFPSFLLLPFAFGPLVVVVVGLDAGERREGRGKNGRSKGHAVFGICQSAN